MVHTITPLDNMQNNMGKKPLNLYSSCSVLETELTDPSRLVASCSVAKSTFTVVNIATFARSAHSCE